MCDIGTKMMNRRKELGLTLEEVGNAVGVGKSTVRKWETGMIKNMGRDKVAALAKVLQMNPVEFVPGEAVPDPDQERLEALHRNPKLGILFDHARKVRPEDVDMLVQLSEMMEKAIYGDD